AGFPATTCFCLFESAAHWLVVTVPPSAYANGNGDELAHALGALMFRSRSGSFIPKVILVGDDVDPADLQELTWAFATRNHPERGRVLFPDRPMLPLVAYLGADERRAARGTKVVYNCLSPDSGS